MGCTASQLPPVNEPDFCAAAHLNTKDSFFFLDAKRCILMKRKHHTLQSDAEDGYENNLRICELPGHAHILRPLKVERTGSYGFEVRMPYARMDLFGWTTERFDCAATLQMMNGVRDAIHWLHDHGVAHRDVKPENIVIRDGRFQLIDFDFSYPSSQFVPCGTRYYMCARQHFQSWTCSPEESSRRMDVYAFGKTLLFILVRASDLNLIPKRRELFNIFHESSLDHYRGSASCTMAPWFTLIHTCCSAFPPLEIPSLPMGQDAHWQQQTV